MFKQIDSTRVLGRSAAPTCLGIAAAIVTLSSAMAGECPAGQMKAGAREAVSFPASGVTDTVLATINLANEPVKLNDHLQRIRKLVVQPGGVVPWHSHTDRPALIYIIEGEINEYASNCTAPILHKAGDVVAETPEVSHWWKNLGNKTVVLLSADLLRDKNDHNM